MRPFPGITLVLAPSQAQVTGQPDVAREELPIGGVTLGPRPATAFATAGPARADVERRGVGLRVTPSGKRPRLTTRRGPLRPSALIGHISPLHVLAALVAQAEAIVASIQDEVALLVGVGPPRGPMPLLVATPGVVPRRRVTEARLR